MEILILDSRDGFLALNNPADTPDHFYRILSSTRYDSSVFTGGDKRIPRDALDLQGFRGRGTINPDKMTEDFIPVAWIKSTRKGTLSGGPPIRNGQLQLEEGVDCLIFYLRIST